MVTTVVSLLDMFPGSANTNYINDRYVRYQYYRMRQGEHAVSFDRFCEYLALKEILSNYLGDAFITVSIDQAVREVGWIAERFYEIWANM